MEEIDKTKRIDKPEKCICKRCRDELLFTPEYFYRDKERKFGLNNVCKKCERLGAQLKYEKDPKKYRESHNKYRQKNLEKTNKSKNDWAKNNPNNAKNSQLKYTYGITLDDYNNMLISQETPVLYVKLYRQIKNLV